MADAAQDRSSDLDISERLRALMRDHKLTVAEMAKVAGVSKSAMEKYLAGPSSPRAAAIVEICEKLATSADWLLLGQPNEEEIIRRGIHSSMYQILMQQKGKEVASSFVPANSDELKMAGKLTEETMRVIAYYRDLAKREAEASAKHGSDVYFSEPLPIIPTEDEPR